MKYYSILFSFVFSMFLMTNVVFAESVTINNLNSTQYLDGSSDIKFKWTPSTTNLRYVGIQDASGKNIKVAYTLNAANNWKELSGGSFNLSNYFSLDEIKGFLQDGKEYRFHVVTSDVKTSYSNNFKVQYSKDDSDDSGSLERLRLSVSSRAMSEGEEFSLKFNDIGADYYIVHAVCKNGVKVDGKARVDICVEGEKVNPTGKDQISVAGFYPSVLDDSNFRVYVDAYINGKKVSSVSRNIDVTHSPEIQVIRLKNVPSEYDLSKKDLDFGWAPKDAVVDNIVIKSTDGSVNQAIHSVKVRGDNPISTGYYNFNDNYSTYTTAQIKNMLPENKWYRFIVSGPNIKEQTSRRFKIVYSGSDSGSSSSTSTNSNNTSPDFSISPDKGDSCNLFSRNLTLGSNGSDVTELQKFLVRKGFLNMPNGVAYGYYGILTQYGLIKYQSAKGIAPATGYFGPMTRSSILLECGSSNSGSSSNEQVGNDIAVEAVSTSASVDLAQISGDSDRGKYTIKFNVTALNDDIWIKDESGVELDDDVNYRIDGGNGGSYEGSNNSSLTSSSNTKRNGYWKIEEGDTETFTLNVTLIPGAGHKSYPYGIGMSFLRYSFDNRGGNTDVYYGFGGTSFQTDQVFID